MRISVALCTFRGHAFVREQLESVLGQLRGPDEVIVRDDASDDDTIAIVDSLSDRFAASGIDLVVRANEANLGVRRNFEQCLADTTGDLIFLCDQDDLWHADKVATMAAVFERRPDLTLLFTNADLIDATGTPIGHTLFEALAISSRERALVRSGAAFEALIRRNLATGATMAFRRSVLDFAVPFADEWLHDEWLAVIAAATSTIDLADEVLIDYRQHHANEVGVRRVSVSNLAQRLLAPLAPGRDAQYERAIALDARLAGLDGASESSRVLAREKVRFQERRLRYPANRALRVVPVLRQAAAGRYHRLVRGTIALARDVFVPGRGL
jgi:glycosyltransferase involved in cell wall biosynthesis